MGRPPRNPGRQILRQLRQAVRAFRQLVRERLHLFGRGRRHAAAEAHGLRDAGEGAALARSHRLHHIGHVAMHLEELVDLLDLLAGAGSDAPLAAGFQEIRMLALLPCHRIDHRDLTLENPVVETGRGDLVLHLGDAGQHAHQAGYAAHVRHLQQLLAHVVQIELALAHLFGGARGFFGIDIGGSLFDQRDHIAHAEDAAGDAGGMEVLQRVGLFAGADQLDRLAGDLTHRQRGAAAAVAVDAGQHDAGEADALIERRARD